MNNFLRVKSKNRAAHLRLAARLFSIMMLAFLWPARGEAQTQPGPLDVSTLSFTGSDNSVTLTCSAEGTWTYKIGENGEGTPFNGTLTGTKTGGKVFLIINNKEVTFDMETYPKLILNDLNYTSDGGVFQMGGNKPVYIQTEGASKLISTGIGSSTPGELYVIQSGAIPSFPLVIDGGSNGLEIRKEAAYNFSLYGIQIYDNLSVILQGKITIAVHNTGDTEWSSSNAIDVSDQTTLSYDKSANIQCMAQEGFSVTGTISSPFLEWTFANAPAAGELEIRDANGQPLDPAVKFTTDGKAKSFTISAKKDTPYTLWLDGKKQKDSNGATVFKTTEDKVISFTGITEFLPSNWSEYGQEAQVGPTGADVSVSDNTHYTVHTPAGLAWIAWVTNNGKNDTADPGKYYPAEAGFEGCTVTLDNDISLAAPTTGVVTSGFNVNWSTIGEGAGNSFKGTFDGGNHTVSGLSITTLGGQYSGLFGYILEADIKNLRVEGEIEGTSSMGNSICVGGIVGMADKSKIIACSNAVGITVTTTATNYELNIGGIVGLVGSGGNIYSCWNEATLSGESSQKLYIGGIVGKSNTSIYNCYSSGPVSGTGTSTSACASGGIVGYIENVKVSNCYATGSVSATNAQDGSTTSAGGIAGHIKNVEVSYCLALNAGDGIKIFANGSTSHVGRIVGQQEGICRLVNNYASTKIKLKKGSAPEAAPTTDIGVDKINGADVYLTEVAEATKIWTGSDNTKAFTTIGTDPATGMLPQLKAIASYTGGLPSTYGDAIADQPAASLKSADYLAAIEPLALLSDDMGTITLSCTDNKWSYKIGDGALTRFDGTVKMGESVNSSPTSLVVETATGNPTLTFENVKLYESASRYPLTIKEGCTLTFHTTGDKPLTLTSNGSAPVIVNKGTLTLTGTGLWIESFGPNDHYCLDNSGTFTVSNPEETSVTFDSFFPTINNNGNSGRLGNAWIEWRFNNGPKQIAFAAIDDTNQSPDAQTVKRDNIATLVTPGNTYRLWKVTGDSPNEVRTRQAGTEDSKTVALFPAPTKGEVAVYTDVKNVEEVTITDSKNFSTAACSEKNVTVGTGGVLTIDAADAQVINLKLEGGQVVTTNPLKVDGTFSTTRELDNQWIAFGSPVAMKASVGEAEGQLLYLGTGYNDSDPLNQCWKNVSGFPDTGKKTADLAADSPYLLAAEEPSTEVTFAATAGTDPLEIPETATMTPGNALADGVFLFRTNPNLSNLTLSNIYVLNAEGTRFELQENYELKPFEAYITANEETCSRVRSLKIGDNIATGIDQPIAATTRIWGTRGTLHISADAPADVMIVTPAGQILRTVKAPAGDTTLALPAGIYFVRCNDITYKVSL